MLNLDGMPEKTRRAFEILSKEPLLRGFILIGGTAMSIQTGHRLSEDLDFWFPEEKLPPQRLDGALSKLKGELEPKLITPGWRITQAKINGTNLLDISRDYSIGGAKITFFARNDVPYRHFAKMERIQNESTFDIASMETIFCIKSWVISQRVRSRDLFDLMTFIESGKTIQDILDAGVTASPEFQPEYAKEVLIGNVPLDTEDEGFDSVQVKLKINEIYQFFTNAVNAHEIDIVRKLG